MTPGTFYELWLAAPLAPRDDEGWQAPLGESLPVREKDKLRSHLRSLWSDRPDLLRLVEPLASVMDEIGDAEDVHRPPAGEYTLY